MKFLLDACASSRSLRSLLADLGHDVCSVFDIDPRASDEVILALALQDARVLITEDKDFGELVFVHRLPHPAIVRFVELRVEEQVEAMLELLDRYSAELEARALIVVTKGRVRIRHVVS
jgi:predicted nuclease of predicted toxin-antitoxin system